MFDKVCRRVTLQVTNCSYGVFTMPWDLRRVLEKTALRVLTASAMLLISPLAALASDTNIHPGFAGIYVARVDKKAPSMSGAWESMELPQLLKIPVPDPLRRSDTGPTTEVRSRLRLMQTRARPLRRLWFSRLCTTSCSRSPGITRRGAAHIRQPWKRDIK